MADDGVRILHTKEGQLHKEKLKPCHEILDWEHNDFRKQDFDTKFYLLEPIFREQLLGISVILLKHFVLSYGEIKTKIRGAVKNYLSGFFR